MAVSVVWDLVTEAELSSHVRNGTRIVRTAHVRGLTSSVTTASEALGEAMAQAPAYGDPYPDVRYETAVVVNVAARGVPGSRGTMARLYVHYESPRLAGGAP